jgi:hypothetical protein
MRHLEILEFVSNFTGEIDAKRSCELQCIWGNGNTAIYCCFHGLTELATRLWEFGAAPNKINERKVHKPVDCANGEEMLNVFVNVCECIALLMSSVERLRSNR